MREKHYTKIGSAVFCLESVKKENFDSIFMFMPRIGLLKKRSIINQDSKLILPVLKPVWTRRYYIRLLKDMIIKQSLTKLLKYFFIHFSASPEAIDAVWDTLR